MYMFIHVHVYVSIVYMLCSPMLEEIKNLSIYLPYSCNERLNDLRRPFFDVNKFQFLIALFGYRYPARC